MIPFIGNVQNRKIHREGKQISSHQGLWGGDMGSDCLMGKGFSFQGDKNTLELDSGGGCITL